MNQATRLNEAFVRAGRVEVKGPDTGVYPPGFREPAPEDGVAQPMSQSFPEVTPRQDSGTGSALLSVRTADGSHASSDWKSPSAPHRLLVRENPKGGAAEVAESNRGRVSRSDEEEGAPMGPVRQRSIQCTTR